MFAALIKREFSKLLGGNNKDKTSIEGMILEHYPAEKLKREILKAAEKYLGPNAYALFFFGSRVCGKGNERSDIDLGVEGEASVPSGAWLDFREAIENIPTLYKIDVVDFGRVTEKFKKVAKQRVQMIQ